MFALLVFVMPYLLKSDQLAYQKKWYYSGNNGVWVRAAVSARRRVLRSFFHDLKKSLRCELCLESCVVCLDFHHKDPSVKDRGVSEIVSRGWSKKRILAEVSKCVVLCSNCHRKVHAGFAKV